MNAPRIGFAGTGRIGARRMKAIAKAQSADIIGVFDPDGNGARAALDEAGLRKTPVLDDYEALLELAPDGVVVSSPNRLHAQQSIQALEHDASVFCQKPLGCTRKEVETVVDTARRQDRLLDVDFTYRQSPALQEIYRRVRAGEIGDIYAADLIFHNAFGPDKTWFYDRAQSGGGCFLDLGVHMVDLALWLFDFPHVENVSSRFFTRGRPVNGKNNDTVEDYALARLDMDNGATAQVACSWHLSAGCNAVLQTVLHGTKGSMQAYNVNGSYFNMIAEKMDGTQKQTLVRPNGRWDSRTAINWTQRLREDNGFASEAVRYGEIAFVLDEVYQS